MFTAVKPPDSVHLCGYCAYFTSWWFFFFFNPDGKINLGNNGKVDYEGDVEKEIICLDETLSLHTLV